MSTATRLLRSIYAGFVVLAVCGVVAAGAAAHAAPETAPGDPLDPRTYAPKSKLFLSVHAIGVQRYTCQANGTWLFTDPVADLYKERGARRFVGSHHLNFATGRPVWEYKDGSSVEAARKVSVPAGTGNIPELLLEAFATSGGDDGDRLARTTWVQRLNTSGGVAPAGTCTPGNTIAVPYATDYAFWKAGGGHDSDD